MEARRVKSWGWGWEDKTIPLEGRPILMRLLEDRLKILLSAARATRPADVVATPPSLLPLDELMKIRQIVGEHNVSDDDAERVAHAGGKGYKDLVRVRSGIVERAPDVVVYPENEEAVRRLLEFARRRWYAVVPFGGGTSVVGGVDPPDRFEAAISLDVRRMNRVIDIDVASGLVTAEAGIRGPALEESLAAKGLTLGHFPQSWEFSSLGGWIATRATGGLSNRYGGIGELLVGVRLVTPVRTIDVRPLPSASHGPDLKELILGSEGSLGVITQATLRAHPKPAVRQFASRVFPSFEDGVVALRRMARDRHLPDMAYLSDVDETRFAAASAGIPIGAGGFVGRTLRDGALLLMGFEGAAGAVVHRRRIAVGYVRGSSANLGSRPAERWFAARFEVPYLRDSFLDHRILVDTVETAAPWSKLLDVYAAGRKALREALEQGGSAGLVLCHISHAYLEGASLYYTFLAPQRIGREIEQWETIKAAVTSAFVASGGALSHHHGIGADHAPYLGRIIGEDGIIVLRALKRELDPEGIMNPGKLLAGLP